MIRKPGETKSSRKREICVIGAIRPAPRMGNADILAYLAAYLPMSALIKPGKGMNSNACPRCRLSYRDNINILG